MHATATQFKEQGYVKIEKALSTEVCELLSSYIRLKAATNPKIRRGKDFLSGVHREYADPMMETLLEQLHSKIEAVTGMSLYPTLSFCYYYSDGTKLPPHKDRASCEIVAALCIDADADFKKHGKTWPLYLKNAPLIELNYGDILVFKGSTTEHWRDTFNGMWFISAIFAYVDQNGANAHHKFDQRKQLGMPHIGMTRWLLGDCFARLQRHFLKPKNWSGRS